MTNEQFIIYLAGFFDGEGHCRIYNNNSSKNKRSSGIVEVGLTQVTSKVLERAKQLFGGNIYQDSPHKNKNWKQAYRWKLTGKLVLPFLKAIDKYIIIKRKQVDLAFEFLLFKCLPKSLTHVIKSGKNIGISLIRLDRTIEKECEYISRSLALNKKGV